MKQEKKKVKFLTDSKTTIPVFTMEEIEKFEEKGIFQEQIEEAKAFVESEEFKNMVKEARESHQRVMESKITDRTKLWLTTPVWRFDIKDVYFSSVWKEVYNENN